MALPSLFGARLVFGTAQAKQKIVVQEQVEEKVYLISVSDDELPGIANLNAEQIEELEIQAYALFEKGDLKGAIHHHERILTWKQQALGKEHLRTAETLFILALFIKNWLDHQS